MTITLDQFVECVVKSGMLSTEELEKYLTALPADKQPQNVQQLALGLCRKGLLTRFQAQVLSEGKSAGLILDDYMLLDKIGQGGMGVVYKAKHQRMNRVVALKVLSKAAMACDRSVKRFYREVEAAARLAHPNIVGAHDAREARGIHYMVMEYIEGDSLADMVAKQGILPIPLVIDVMTQAALGLGYAHQQGMVHRDIKPGNLLLSKEGVLKVLDLGLVRMESENLAPGAEAAEGLTKSNHMMGTPDYMAPEQAINPKHADHRSDIYALGCTMYRLLTGHVPYAGETTMERVLAHQNAPLPSIRYYRSDVPAELEAVFHRMVAKQPADRFQSMEDVVAALQSVKLKLSQAMLTPLSEATPSHYSVDSNNLVDGATQISPQQNTPYSVPALSAASHSSLEFDYSENSSALPSHMHQSPTASGTRHSSDSLVHHPISSEPPMEKWEDLLAEVPTEYPPPSTSSRSRKGTSRDRKSRRGIDPLTKWLLMGATAVGVFLMGVMGLMILRSGRPNPNLVAQNIPPETPVSNNTPVTNPPVDTTPPVKNTSVNNTPPTSPADPISTPTVTPTLEPPTTPVENPPLPQPPTDPTPTPVPADPPNTYPHPSPPPKDIPDPLPPVAAVSYHPAEDLLKDLKLPPEFGKNGWRNQTTGLFTDALGDYPQRPFFMEFVNKLPVAYRLTLELKALTGGGHLFVVFSSNDEQYALPIHFNDGLRGPSKRGAGNGPPGGGPGGKGPPPPRPRPMSGNGPPNGNRPEPPDQQQNGPDYNRPPPPEMDLVKSKVTTFVVTVNPEGIQVTRDGVPVPQNPPPASETPRLPTHALFGNHNLLIGNENCSFLISRLTLEAQK